MADEEVGDTPFHTAAKEGDMAVLKKASKKDLYKEDKDGWIPLHWASWVGNLEAMRIVLAKG